MSRRSAVERVDAAIAASRASDRRSATMEHLRCECGTWTYVGEGGKHCATAPHPVHCERCSEECEDCRYYDACEHAEFLRGCRNESDATI